MSNATAKWRYEHTADGGDDHRRQQSRRSQIGAANTPPLADHCPKAATRNDSVSIARAFARRGPGCKAKICVRPAHCKRRTKKKIEASQVEEYESPGATFKYVGAEKMTAG